MADILIKNRKTYFRIEQTDKQKEFRIDWTDKRNIYSLGRKVKVQELEKQKGNFTCRGRNFPFRSLTVV